MLVYNNKKLSKIPTSIMDPIDIITLKFYSHFFDSFSRLGITPNMLTIVSGILQGIGNYYIWSHQTYLGGIFWIVGNSLDIVDGSYARYTKLCSKFGDYLDHGKDITMQITLLIIGLSKYQTEWCYVLIVFIIFILHSLHLGYDQKASDPNNQSLILSSLQKFVPNINLGPYIRYCGSSLSIIYIMIVIINLTPK
jgi:phosphatidylglycerophosphate synthase